MFLCHRDPSVLGGVFEYFQVVSSRQVYVHTLCSCVYTVNWLISHGEETRERIPWTRLNFEVTDLNGNLDQF